MGGRRGFQACSQPYIIRRTVCRALTSAKVYRPHAVPCPRFCDRWITLALDGSFGDIGGVSVWPLSDSYADIALGQNLTVWLHAQANFSTDTTKVACDVTIRTITMFETYSQCPPVSGVRYGEGHAGALTPHCIAFWLLLTRMVLLLTACACSLRCPTPYAVSSSDCGVGVLRMVHPPGLCEGHTGS